MAAPSLEQLKSKAIALGIEFKPDATATDLKELINAREPANPGPSDSGEQNPPKTEIPMPSQPSQQMIPLADVKALIAEALAAQADKDKPVKVKRTTEHHAHVWRLNGKWVVDFADRNFDYDNNVRIDPYITVPIHAYQVFNQQKREYEAWIKLIFQDKSTEEIPLNRYVERRTLVYCKIIKRHPKDLSYSIGEVEKKKESGDKLVGTGIMVDQEVSMYAEVFEIETPEGEILKLPDYVVA